MLGVVFSALGPVNIGHANTPVSMDLTRGIMVKNYFNGNLLYTTNAAKAAMEPYVYELLSMLVRMNSV
ncbi:MAG: hypothetical protein LBI37_01580, partial [Puniceicoccales bacterium]|nr:hypothetical protein [Puniceicoccales bacterium]